VRSSSRSSGRPASAPGACALAGGTGSRPKIMQEALTAKIAAAARMRDRGGASGPVMISTRAFSRGRNCSNRCLPPSELATDAWFRSRKRNTSLPSIKIVMYRSRISCPVSAVGGCSLPQAISASSRAKWSSVKLRTMSSFDLKW